ncbi:hypothetical protein ACROYT_G039221 [Oculina patagonica]
MVYCNSLVLIGLQATVYVVIYHAPQICDLSDNQITRITQEDLEHLQKLQKVYLKGNPFHCDCNLEWLRLKLHNSPAVIQDGDSIQCATPSKIHNKALKSLSNLCDIDKCNDKNRPCEGQLRCANVSLPGSTEKELFCGCKHGFDTDKLQGKCKDINECKKPKICPRYAICTNTNGSYECNCEEGYSKKSGECKDIDECETGAHKCDETTTQCQNLEGDYHCPCRTGFTKTQDKCVDIDECKQDPGVCGDKRATCKNTIGSFECICEKTGYEYNSEARNCSDTDECVDKPCGDDKNMKCKNSQGSYSCDCEPQYRKDGNVCKDIDECADNKTLCEGDMKCFNSLGSYKCDCGDGYLRAYQKCVDIDECKIRRHNCFKQSYCRNSPGSFKCVCPKGYKLKSDGKSCLIKKKKIIPRGGPAAGTIVLCVSVVLALLCLSAFITVMVRKIKKKKLAREDKVGDETEDTDIIPVAEHKSADGNVEAATSQD